MDRIIKVAPEGILLTDGINYVKKIYLAEDADSSKWHEITEAKYNQIVAEQETDLEVM